MPNWETLQAVAQSRYKQDVPGAYRRALLNGGNIPASDMTTEVNGLIHLISPSQTEWHNPDAFNSIFFTLSVNPAP